MKKLNTRIKLNVQNGHAYSYILTKLNPGPAEPGYTLPLETVDADQLASEEANWSGSALFAIKYVNLYQQPGTSNRIGRQLEVGVASYIIQHDKG